jgi:hypothetical protein
MVDGFAGWAANELVAEARTRLLGRGGPKLFEIMLFLILK